MTCQVSYLVMFAYISMTLGDATNLSTFYISTKVLQKFRIWLVCMLYLEIISIDFGTDSLAKDAVTMLLILDFIFHELP